MLLIRKFFRLYGPYLQRPALWPEIYRSGIVAPVKRRMGFAVETVVQREAAKATATRWCDEHTVDIEEGLRALGLTPPSDRVEKTFKREFTRASAEARSAGIKLGGAGNLTLLYSLADQMGAMRVVETGVAFGWSSFALLLSLRDRSSAKLFSVDLPYFELRNDSAVGCVVPPELRAQWQLFRMADREGLPRALRAAKPVDLCHYDSDKSSRGRAWAYARMWDALRPGGILVTDDAGDNFAFRDFARQVHVTPVIIRHGNKFQGALIKA